MNFKDLSDSRNLEFDFFVRALTQVFHGESWDEVQPYAERAWLASGLGADLPWTDVQSEVRAAWPKA
ncbi:hypothetical protein LVB87_11625 [Lysobacter sp. KIS68-7]|uniref:hypothetical protein n=1 Tax=Lysobacter sp. KIS68-7 TaxID=2904252 RepID=UPI001E47F7CD|nr:hypothetical protein [Lysobacter sp. KIS68-7]UHQ18830.1 hypothetical protein LVB87_11625 [Lysobacter sp. KIS68-7]